MSHGLVTFFEYEQLGFYKRGDEYHEKLPMEDLLANLLTWYRQRDSLADTLLWDANTPGYGGRKKVYLKSIKKHEDTDEYLVILWREIGSGDGVYGLRSDSSLDDEKLYNADDSAKGKEVIWGEALYYWFIPSLNIFSSIKFAKSIADTKTMNTFLKDFVWLQSTVRNKNLEIKKTEKGTEYTSVTFPSEKGNLWFRARSKQFTKTTGKADLSKIASEITHFVKREVISAEVMKASGWERFCNNLPFMGSDEEEEKGTRKLELMIDASPTEEQLTRMLNTYHDDFEGNNDGWSNLGFRKEGVGGTCWLDEFVIKSVLIVPDLKKDVDESAHYTSDRLFLAIDGSRDKLLAPFGVMPAALQRA